MRLKSVGKKWNSGDLVPIIPFSFTVFFPPFFPYNGKREAGSSSFLIIPVAALTPFFNGKIALLVMDSLDFYYFYCLSHCMCMFGGQSWLRYIYRFMENRLHCF